jgi:hypothetical protein
MMFTSQEMLRVILFGTFVHNRDRIDMCLVNNGRVRRVTVLHSLLH